jgi:LysM repeat protein
MAEKNSPQNVIESYKRNQKRMPYIVGGLAIILVIVGVIILITALSSGGTNMFRTATPTATNTFTPTNTLQPTATATASLTPTITVTRTPTITATINGPMEYTVQQGDTCWDLAVKFKVDFQALLAINNFPVGTCPIKPGDKIIIPAIGSQLPTATPIDISRIPPNTIYEYIVQQGDTLASIASMFNSTQDAIVKLNNITDVNNIQFGQKLKIPVNIVTPTPTKAPTATPAGTLTPTYPPAVLPSATVKVTSTPKP